MDRCPVTVCLYPGVLSEEAIAPGSPAQMAPVEDTVQRRWPDAAAIRIIALLALMSLETQAEWPSFKSTVAL